MGRDGGLSTLCFDNHFRPKAFLSEQPFPTLPVPCSSAQLFSLNFTTAVDFVLLHSVTLSFAAAGFILPVILFQDFEYLPVQIFNWHLVASGAQF